MGMSIDTELKTLLRESGLRATTPRVQVLAYLTKQDRPVGIERLDETFPKINTATLYRMMRDFAKHDLVVSHDLGHGHVDYKIKDKLHHHYLVCEDCGHMEDVSPCEEQCAFEKAVLGASKQFNAIKRQQVTFFGTCKSCAT